MEEISKQKYASNLNMLEKSIKIMNIYQLLIFYILKKKEFIKLIIIFKLNKRPFYSKICCTNCSA